MDRKEHVRLYLACKTVMEIRKLNVRYLAELDGLTPGQWVAKNMRMRKVTRT